LELVGPVGVAYLKKNSQTNRLQQINNPEKIDFMASGGAR
jgi:hypothetical protein